METLLHSVVVASLESSLSSLCFVIVELKDRLPREINEVKEI